MSLPIIQAVDRALRILDLFNKYEKELKINDISLRMGLHKSTVHSLLKTLQQHSYIEQNLDNGKYKLGMKLFERGNFFINSLSIRTISKKHQIEISKITGNTTHLVILDGKEGVYIDKVEGSADTIQYSSIGRRIPIHCSAEGKTLLAFKGKEEMRALIEGYDYISHTPNTIRNENDFLAELKNVRENGYAVDNEENITGVMCIAVPIRNHTGNVVAAISMSQRVHLINNSLLNERVNMLKKTAEIISHKLDCDIQTYKNE